MMKAIIQFFSLFSTLPNNRDSSPRSALSILGSVLITLFQGFLLHFAAQSCKNTKLMSESANLQIYFAKLGFRRDAVTFFYFLLDVILACLLYVPHADSDSSSIAILRRAQPGDKLNFGFVALENVVRLVPNRSDLETRWPK